VLEGTFAVGSRPGLDYPSIHTFQCMLERTDAKSALSKVLDTVPSETADNFTSASLGFPQGVVLSTYHQTRLATYAVVSSSFTNRLCLRKWCLPRAALTATLLKHYRVVMYCWGCLYTEVSIINDYCKIFSCKCQEVLQGSKLYHGFILFNVEYNNNLLDIKVRYWAG
jgi:hypothetical protein